MPAGEAVPQGAQVGAGLPLNDEQTWGLGGERRGAEGVAAAVPELRDLADVGRD